MNSQVIFSEKKFINNLSLMESFLTTNSGKLSTEWGVLTTANESDNSPIACCPTLLPLLGCSTGENGNNHKNRKMILSEYYDIKDESTTVYDETKSVSKQSYKK